MIGIKMTDFCEGCELIEPYLQGSSLLHEWSLYCKHQEACERIYRELRKKEAQEEGMR